MEPESIIEKTGLSIPHTSHCLANGQVMISMMGDKDKNGKGTELIHDNYITMIIRENVLAFERIIKRDFFVSK